ncbi:MULTISPECIES: cell division protein ZapA [Pseudomonas]|jgi:cell division protein ZapA|uniref:Cell division protein ZapA n=1 Tax=Serpens gallinarum TaxID=2763075 RepID=A0ABR8TPR0_9PSED|nr:MULTISPECIES: cell division protein ZapA [Pseudomonas]MBD7977755.1 cell division protein ZapA [Serpens gallinarum]MBF0674921.1 cell division protein ZapA [Pseudomonas sp.]
MKTPDNAVSVLSIFGRDYTVKAPEGKQQLLEDSAALLRTHIKDIQRQRPGLRPDELFLLAALSVCSRHLEQQAEYHRELIALQQRLNSTKERIQGQIETVQVG